MAKLAHTAAQPESRYELHFGIPQQLAGPDSQCLLASLHEFSKQSCRPVCCVSWSAWLVPGNETVDLLVKEAHESREGFPREISRLAFHIVQQVMLAIAPSFQGS